MPVHAGIPVPHFRSRHPPHEGLVEHDDGPAARGHRGRQALWRRRGPALRLARGPARRGPRAHGRQRRRQEHPRQDPDRRRPPGPRHDPRPRHAVSWPVRRARLGGAGSCRSTRNRRSSPTSTSPRICDSRARRSSPSAHWLAELGIPSLDLTTAARALPLATLRVIDLARALAVEPAVLMLDEMTAALPGRPDRTRPRGHRATARHRQLDHLHLAPDDRDRRRVRPRHRPARRGDGRGRRRRTRLGGADRPVDAGRHRGGRDRPAGPAPARRRRLPSAARRASAPRAWGSPPKLVDVSFELYPGEVLGVVALEGQGQDELFDILAGSERPRTGELLVDERPVVVPPPGRRDPRRSRLRPRRPRRGAPDAALGPREHRPAVHGTVPVVGPDRRTRRGIDGSAAPSNGSRSTPVPRARSGACRAATSRR